MLFDMDFDDEHAFARLIGGLQEVPPEPVALLTLREVAERLSVSRSTVERLIGSGQLCAIKVGGGRRAPVRVRERELEDRITHWTKST
jgi:excisionase family DNA binding protein